MRISNHIPNTITSMNLLCGIIGVICVFEGKPDWAFILMLGAAACDFFDGFSARALNAYSSLGKELDSLADLVSFGLLPSVMLYRTMLCSNAGEHTFWCFIPLSIAIFSALRLAKFNTDDRQEENFIGLATPASAMICGSFVYYTVHEPDSFLAVLAAENLFIPAMSILLSVLLVSEIPMFSMKFKKGMSKESPIYRQRVTFLGIIVISAVLVLVFGLNWSMTVLLSFTAYIILNLAGKRLFR